MEGLRLAIASVAVLICLGGFLYNSIMLIMFYLIPSWKMELELQRAAEPVVFFCYSSYFEHSYLRATAYCQQFATNAENELWRRLKPHRNVRVISLQDQPRPNKITKGLIKLGYNPIIVEVDWFYVVAFNIDPDKLKLAIDGVVWKLELEQIFPSTP